MIEFKRNRHVLEVAGELTIFHAAEAKARFQEELAKGSQMEVDLSQVSEMDTAGAQVLLWLKRQAQASGRTVPFIRHSPAALDVLEQLNLAGLYGDTLVISPA
jgi:anti-sigma B factor antagonist